MSLMGYWTPKASRRQGGILFLLMALFLTLAASPSALAQDDESSFGGKHFRRFNKFEDPGEKWKKNLQWKMGLSGRTYESDRETAHLGTWSADFDSAFIFTDYLQMDVNMALVLGTGRSQALYQDFIPTNNFRLNRASVILHSVDHSLIFSAGVEGRLYDAPQLRSGVAFPGITETIQLGQDPIRLRLAAQQATPTSETKFSEATEIEPTPMYNTELVELTMRPLPSFLLAASGAHYRFKDLPRIVAYRSFLAGNLEITGGGPESSIFTTGFDGYIGTGRILWDLSSVELDLGQQWVYNSKAPERQNMGQVVWGKSKFKGPRHDWTPGFVYFVTESDVGPAIYADSKYGRNNRKGYSVELELKFRDEGFKLTAWYTRADVILPSATQDNQQVFNLSFETDFQRIF